MNVSNITEQNNYFSDNKESSKDNKLSDLYSTSLLRYAIYSTLCSLEGVVGIIGNILTLIIIRTLKSRTNVHILMAYLAVADILVCCQFPLELSRFAYETQVYFIPDWETLCAIGMCVYGSATAGCMLSYTILAVDR